MSISKATAHWGKSLKDGSGWMKPAHGQEVAFTVGTRFQGERGSNPEELIGAALAGCFSMALTAALARAGLNPESVDTSAGVHLEREGEGWKIMKIELTTAAKVPGADPAKFATIAEDTKKGCPVSKALTGTVITLNAKLS